MNQVFLIFNENLIIDYDFIGNLPIWLHAYIKI